MAAPVGLDSPPKTSGSDLGNVINWLKEDIYTVLYFGNAGYFYHKCDGAQMTDDQIKNFFETHQVVYLDVSERPGLLDDDGAEWPSYIQEAGFNRCTCSLQGRVSTGQGIPHKFEYSLQ